MKKISVKSQDLTPLKSQDLTPLQPEILMDAKQGVIDESLEINRDTIFGLLNGSIPSQDSQQEAYRLLLVAACNDWHRTMPFLFEKIADYTELLMPDDLLSGTSILAYTREALYPEACQDVEVIGWLYQFYISEKKDEVFEGLKKNQKITPEISRQLPSFSRRIGLCATSWITLWAGFG